METNSTEIMLVNREFASLEFIDRLCFFLTENSYFLNDLLKKLEGSITLLLRTIVRWCKKT